MDFCVIKACVAPIHLKLHVAWTAVKPLELVLEVNVEKAIYAQPEIFVVRLVYQVGFLDWF